MNRIPPALASLFVALVCGPLAAADPAPGGAVDTSFLKRYAQTRGFTLGRPQKPKFTPDGKTVLFLRAEPTTPKLKLFSFDVATATTTELLSPETLLKGAEEALTPEEKARRERQRVTVGGFADYHLSPDGGRVLVTLSSKPYVFDRGTGKARELPVAAGVTDVKWSPDGNWVSYVRGFDVFAFDLAAGKEVAVTTGGTREKTHGVAEFVAQEEMDRFTGYWWSPDSKSMAYTEADHAGVEVWHVADPFKPGTAPSEQYYPRPGHKNVSVRLGVKPVVGGETRWLDWDREKYEYLGRVAWGVPGIMLVLQSRDQRTLEFTVIDPANGSVLGVHTHPPGGVPNGWYELPPAPIPFKHKPSFVVFRTPNAEFVGPGPQDRPFAAWVETFEDGMSIAGFTTVDDVIAFDETGGNLTFTAHPADPTQRQVYRATLLKRGDQPKADGPGGGVQLTSTAGINTAAFSKDTSVGVFTTTTLSSMPESRVAVAERDGRTLGVLPSVADEPPFTPNVSVEKVGDFWTAVVRPKNFDPKKKYPVLVDVYGGPHHQHVLRAMRNWLIPQWLADQGFIVVAVENRGTPGRGRDWERAIYRKFGTVPLEDQAKGLAALCDRFPELDRERVGIVGWSFGGYMAANAVLRRPDVFKAAVAGAPVTDWEDYDTHYTERYMGLLPADKAAYDAGSLLPLAKDLKRPLLLVHGTADDNVYYRHTLKLSDALFRAGKEFEVLPLPGVTHQYSADPAVTERLWARAVAFFKQHLGGPK